ncbi:hypothetical protein RN607_00695 [Demequina capsici]|uniref:Uncharacterized protein n=1 Tax=Demequina capsici TaxID=3075620 RepID=A0AA96FFC6_9MICO|nr:hypothetical protein [Demequina sp. PMTSA13]WNM27551.1 hypothetical protein RN607_00695 [Demequina sp. PMTSA13]
MASSRSFTGLSTKKLNEVLQAQAVRSALEARARRVLPRTRAIAYEVGASEFAGELHVEQGTRPGAKADGGLKRPYARIIAELTPEQRKKDGRTRLTRRQILRKGAFGG